MKVQKTTRNTQNTFMLDVHRFNEDLKVASKKTFAELCKELGVNSSYFSNCNQSGTMNKFIYMYLCQTYHLDENSYKRKQSVTTNEVVNASNASDVVKLLTSIDKNLFELIKEIRNIKDETLQIHGKVTNCNVNTSELKKNLIELNRAFGVEKLNV